MSRIKVLQEIEVYEINDKEVSVKDTPILKIFSHWNYNDYVTLQLQDGLKYTVDANDLITAVKNAQNSGGV